MLRNFLFRVARIEPDWSMSSFVERVVKESAEAIGDGHVICALSGGVDSTVVAVLLHKAIGRRLHCIFVDNGLRVRARARKWSAICASISTSTSSMRKPETCS